MSVKRFAGIPILAAAVLVVFTSTSCATKKFVRQTVDPVSQRVSELDKKAAEHDEAIHDLEQLASRANERAMTADSKAVAAARDAAAADEKAVTASREAGDARSAAETGIRRAAEVGAKVDNLENYEPVVSENVLFDFDRSDLTSEAKQVLDAAVAEVAGKKHYVIEVQGFTDTTGASQYNLELSRRRASAVVRYLTLQHNIPLYRIHTMGYGSENPVADNTTRTGRQENRRVEIRVFMADLGQATQVTGVR